MLFFSKSDTQITHNATQRWRGATDVCWALFFLTPHLQMLIVARLEVFWPVQHWNYLITTLLSFLWSHEKAQTTFSKYTWCCDETQKLSAHVKHFHHLRFVQCCVQTNTNRSHLHGKKHCHSSLSFIPLQHWTCTNRQSHLTHACIYLWAPRAVNMILSCAGSRLVCLK